MKIRCGNHPRELRVYHGSVQEVRECSWDYQEAMQQNAIERDAERRVERFFEERGAR